MNSLNTNYKPLILDGAIGSYLELKYPELNDNKIWMTKLNISQPNLILNLYEEYLLNGADILTTNTFTTQPSKFVENDFFDEKCLNLSKINVTAAVNILSELKLKYSDRNILIAGSNSPAEYCYSGNRTLSIDQLKYNHHNHINFLYQSGVDFILNETFSHFDEIKIVIDYCENNNIKYAISFIINDDLKILSGEDIYEVIKYTNQFNPLFVSINCCFYKTFLKLIQTEKINEINNKFGFYLNCGAENFDKSEKSIKVEEMKNILDEILKYIKIDNIFCIGTCCMSDPDYTKEIYKYLNK